MANFVMCIDGDRERRQRFAEAVRERVHLLPGLVGGECASGAFTSVWAASRHAPVSAVSDELGAAVVWGLAFHEHVDRAVDAVGLRQAWDTVPQRVPDAFDGYHAAVSVRGDGTLVLGADVLGLYPLYYWTDGVVFLAGSSAELFRHHPRFEVQLDVEGLIGILLIMTTFGGRTLFKGVRRAEPGHLVVRTPQGEVVEHAQYRIPLSDEHYGLPFTAVVNKLDEAMDGAVRRHVSTAQRHVMLLSGGLDSRTLAGYLSRQGHRPVALTFGASYENEMRFARQVARVAGLEHRGTDLSLAHHAEWAEHHARWTHLANGFHSIEYWQVHPTLAAIAPRMLNAYCGDPVIGGSHVGWMAGDASFEPSLDALLTRAFRTAIPASTVQAMLAAPDARALVRKVLDEIHEELRTSAPTPYAAGYLFFMHHRVRFHAGSVPFLKCFGSWPVMPMADRRLLQFVGGCPPCATGGRRLQIGLIQSKFETLAAIEVDRNSFDTHPLLPSLRYEMRTKVQRRVRSRLHLPAQKPRLPYYWRLFDYNNAGWRSIRARTVELMSKRIDEVLLRSEVEKYIGDATKEVILPDPIVGTSGHKLLHGFILWASAVF